MPTVGTGKYTYTFIQDWAKLPPGETFAMVSAVATDSHDRVYGFQRTDPLIIPRLIRDFDFQCLKGYPR